MLAVCSCCKKLFDHKVGPELCDICDEKIYLVVKEYLNEHPLSSLKEINKDTKIPTKIISSYIKSGRIVRLDNEVSFCTLCGDVKEESMKYCLKCLDKIRIVNELNNMGNQSNNPSEEMRYFNNKRIR